MANGLKIDCNFLYPRLSAIEKPLLTYANELKRADQMPEEFRDKCS
jgi:hypothetical protein